MYLSRLILNPRSRQVRKELSASYQLHRTLLRAFPPKEEGGSGRVLFRVDINKFTGVPTVYVQSEKEPDWNYLAALNDYLLNTGESIVNPAHKSMDNQLRKIRPGQLLAFRLLANPTFKRQGKRFGWLKEEDQIEWLRRKAGIGGFHLISVRIVPEGMVKDKKIQDRAAHQNTASHPLTFLSIRFDGVLRVADIDRFLHIVKSGIGSAKALGFGLLSLGPV